MNGSVCSDTEPEGAVLPVDLPCGPKRAQRTSVLVLSKGRDLSFDRNKSTPLVWLVRSGAVIHGCLYPDGRRQIFNFYYSGDVIFTDLICNLEGAVGYASVDTELLYAGDRLGGFSDVTSLECARACVEAMAMLYQRRELHAAVIGQLSREERTAFFLLEAALWLGRPTSSGLRIELPMSRHDIADYLGLNVATISRTLALLHRQGVIRHTAPKSILVDDLDELARITPVSDALISLHKAHSSRDWKSSPLFHDAVP